MKHLGREEIDISKIDMSNRLRPINDAHVAILAQNIRDSRLRTPIEVVVKGDRYRLIAGGHRVVAFKLLQRPKIEADLYEASTDEARLLEIDENLIRHELNPLDRAVFLAERKALWEKLHPETKRGGNKNVGKSKAKSQNDTVSFWSFARETAEKIGISERAIQRAVSIATGLTPETRKAIAGSTFARKQSELLVLAKLTPSQQQKLLPLLLSPDGKFSSVRSARDHVLGRAKKPLAPVDKAWATIVRLPARDQRSLLVRLQSHLAPRPRAEAAE